MTYGNWIIPPTIAVALIGCGGPMLTRATDLREPNEFPPGVTIAVEEFALDKAQLPERTDDWYKNWDLDLKRAMAERITAKLNEAGLQARIATSGAPAQYHLRGHFLKIEPGKKATRGVAMAFGGYAGDAGKAYIELEGDIADASGKQVLTWYHKEVPGQSFVTDATGAFADAIANTATKMANELEERIGD